MPRLEGTCAFRLLRKYSQAMATRMTFVFARTLVCTVVIGRAAFAQGAAQRLPPFRQLGPVEARSTALFKSVSLVRPLRNGTPCTWV